MCEQVANRAGRWSKERTYTRRAISSQYVVCAIYTYDTMYMIHYIFRWSKERTYTRRAISSQYVVPAFVHNIFTADIRREHTYNHSYWKRTHLHRAISAFVCKLFLLLMHLLLLCTSYFLLILRAIVASFYVPAITNHYKLGWSSQKGATLIKYCFSFLNATHSALFVPVLSLSFLTKEGFFNRAVTMPRFYSLANLKVTNSMSAQTHQQSVGIKDLQKVDRQGQEQGSHATPSPLLSCPSAWETLNPWLPPH